MFRRAPKHSTRRANRVCSSHPGFRRWPAMPVLRRSRRSREIRLAPGCSTLMDGRALTASELARVAGITPQTATGHLARMTAVGLLTVKKQGRHRYHCLASAAVAQMMESIMQVASSLEGERPKLTVGPRDRALRAARTCYDHLAGRLGVSLADALVAAGHAELATDAGVITKGGIEFLARLGIDTGALLLRQGKRRPGVLCRPCLDWSERRPHLAGA